MNKENLLDDTLAGFLGNKKTPKWSFQLVSQFSCKT